MRPVTDTREMWRSEWNSLRAKPGGPCCSRGAYVALQTPADAQKPPTALAVDFHDLRTHTLLGEAF